MTEDDLALLCGVPAEYVMRAGDALGWRPGPVQPRQYDLMDAAVLLTYGLIDRLISSYCGYSRDPMQKHVAVKIRKALETGPARRWLVISADGWETTHRPRAADHPPGVIIVDLDEVARALREMDEQLGYPLFEPYEP